jgi:LemA protein
MLDERADAAFADIDALLMERRSLIDNLVEIVRAFASREHEVIREVLTTRVEQLEAISKGNIHADTQIAGVLQNLFSVSENYPKLTSGAHYASLRDDLVRIEDRITAARRFYNLAVEENNGVRRAFPGNWIVGPGEPVREKFSLGERRADFAEPVKISL